jgi:hypothetical protein
MALRFYFTGGIESTAELSRQGRLDALLITSWLRESARAANAPPVASRLTLKGA